MSSPITEHTVPWPDDVAARYVTQGYWVGRTLADLLVQAAEARPAAPAVIDGDLMLTHRQLQDRVGAAAVRLRGLGIARGERIVLQLGNTWEFVVLTLACLRAGIVPVMALPAHRHTELSYLAA